MILVLLLACASCGSSAPTPQEVTVPDTGHVVEDDAPTAPPAEDVVTPAKEQKADDAGAGEGEAPEVDPDAPLTHGDLQAILDLAADAGAGAATDARALEAHARALAAHRGELQAQPGRADFAAG